MCIVCEKMHYTYEEYQSQPTWFISSLLIKWNEEGIFNKESSKDK